MIKVNDEFLENVKHVLFGLQKQANVINDAVVSIVASELIAAYGHEAVVSEESVVDGIRTYLEHAITSGIDSIDEQVAKLIAGTQSVANLKMEAPRIVSCEPISDTSPKRAFRVYILGDKPDVEITAEEGSGAINATARPKVSPDEVTDPNDDFYTRACKLRDAIMPLVSEGVKAEIPDNEFAQALCCAEYYYGYNR